MTLVSTLSIEEEYVSPTVLPNEPLFGWVKWNDDADIDRVIIKCEADVEIKSLFDVDSSIVVNGSTVEIPTDMLTAGGFIGFEATYSTIPESKRQISFQVDLVKGDEVKTLTLSSCVTKPEIIFTPHNGIVIDAFTPQPNVSFDIYSGKETPALNPKISIEITGNDVKIVNDEIVESSEQIDSLYSQKTITQNITVKGKGTGFVVVSLDYSDVIGNTYHEILQNIPIEVKSTNPETFSVAKNIAPPELLYVS